jgi:Rod binding domain-containing protein
MQIGATLGGNLHIGSANGDQSKKVAEAAKQFESILMNEMLKSAHAADGDDDQDTAISDYGQQQFAQALAERGGLGIAKIVIAGLEKHAH